MALCQPHGSITNILLLKNNQALVQFAELDGAIDFINSYKNKPCIVKGVKAIPNYSSHNELSKGSISKGDTNVVNNGKQQEPNHILLVTISKTKSIDVTIDSLHEIFSLEDTCPIEKIVMFNKTAGLQALIQYADVHDAVEAKKRLQGEVPFSPSNPLLIQYSNLKDLTVHQNSDKARDYTKQSPTTTTSPTVVVPTTSTLVQPPQPSLMKRITPPTNTTPNVVSTQQVQQQSTLVHQLQQDVRSRSNSFEQGVIQTPHLSTNGSASITNFMNNIPPTSAPTNIPNTTNQNGRVSMAHLPESNIGSSFFSYTPFAAHREGFGFSSAIPSAHHHHSSHSNPTNSNAHHHHHHSHNHHNHPSNSVQNQFLNHNFLSNSIPQSNQPTVQSHHSHINHQAFNDNLVMSNGVVVLSNGVHQSNAPNGNQYHLLNNGFNHLSNQLRNPQSSANPPKNTNGIISAPIQNSGLMSNDNAPPSHNQLRLNVLPSTNTSNTPPSTLGTIGSSITGSRLLATSNPQTIPTPNPPSDSEEPTEEELLEDEQDEDEEVESDSASKDNNSEKSSVLLVSNFNDKSMNCDLLFNLFSCYGYIHRIKIFKTKPDHALVQMATHKQALNAINSLKGLQIFGKTLSVNFSKHTFINSSKSDNNMKDFTKTNLNRFPRIVSPSSSTPSIPSDSPTNSQSANGKQHNKLYMCQPTPTLHISNVPFEKDEKGRELLFNIFSKFGEIEGLRVFRHNDKPMALIKFKTVTAAAEALSSLHNENISGKHMKVAFSLNTVASQHNKK